MRKNRWAGAVLAGVVWAAGPAAVAFADHGGGDCDWRGDCGGNEYEHDYSNNDRNRNRDRERGAFSPGPFDDSPVTLGPICMPNSTCHFDGQRGERGQDPGGSGQPR